MRVDAGKQTRNGRTPKEWLIEHKNDLVKYSKTREGDLTFETFRSMRTGTYLLLRVSRATFADRISVFSTLKKIKRPAHEWLSLLRDADWNLEVLSRSE